MTATVRLGVIGVGAIVGDEEIKEAMAARKPYRQWLNDNLVDLDDLPELPAGLSLNGHGPAELLEEQQVVDVDARQDRCPAMRLAPGRRRQRAHAATRR